MDPIIIVAAVCAVLALMAVIMFIRSSHRVEQLTVERATAVQGLEIERAKLEQGLSTEKDLLVKSEEARRSTESNLEESRVEITKLSSERARLESEIKISRERMEEQEDLVKQAKESFKVLADESLRQQQRSFMDSADASLKERQEAVEKLVKPLADKIETLDKARADSAGALRQQITTLANETRLLSTALTKPQTRGQWGEMRVERVLELSGLTKGIHFETQSPDNQGGRTDFIVHMPHGRDIILDSKVSLIAIIDAQDAETEDQRSVYLDSHARMMQSHADSLASKEYWNQLPDSADFVVMVVPEFALPAAVERRPNLIDRALANNVVIATHSTLVALLKTVAMGWQERKIAEEANQIGMLGRELHDRLETFATHYSEIGRSLDRAVQRYNSGVGSLESRVLTQARRFPELGVQTTKELPEIQTVDTSVREGRALPSRAGGNGSPSDER